VGERFYTNDVYDFATRDDDPEFSDLSNTVLQALFAAEQRGITQSTAS